MRSNAIRIRAACLSAGLLTWCSLGLSASLDSALEAKDLDLAACRTLHNNQPTPADPAVVKAVLGLADAKGAPSWSAGKVEVETAKGDTFQYVLGFSQPVALGAVLHTCQAVAFLKADAPYPGDPADGSQWEQVEAAGNQGQVKVATLPRIAQTRAVLFTDRLREGRSQLWLARLFRARLHNFAPTASARASSEYAAPPSLGNRVFRATDVVRGRGPWQSNGKNENGKVVGVPIGDMHPSWLLLGWGEPQEIAGVFLVDNFVKFRIDRFNGAAGRDPQIASENEWETLPQAQLRQAPAFPGRWDRGRWLSFPKPLKAGGIRLRILKTEPARIAAIDSLVILSDLAGQPVPRSRSKALNPPLAIPYKIGDAGTVTMVVDDAAGGRVRNLVARAERKAGDNREHWDLTDEAGHYVQPGTYRWKGITAPPLQLRYELTVYPNVGQLHPENSAWFNSWPGSGGWLADHSAPYGGCASGDLLFFGAPCPESGVGFICCDLTGRKSWAIYNFDNWSGARRIAGDGKTVYAENGVSPTGEARDLDRVWAIDPDKRSFRSLLKVHGTEKRRRGIAGMAARDGKLFLAIRAAEDYFARTANAALVDIEKCRPRPAPGRTAGSAPPRRPGWTWS